MAENFDCVEMSRATQEATAVILGKIAVYGRKTRRIEVKIVIISSLLWTAFPHKRNFHPKSGVFLTDHIHRNDIRDFRKHLDYLCCLMY